MCLVLLLLPTHHLSPYKPNLFLFDKQVYLPHLPAHGPQVRQVPDIRLRPMDGQMSSATLNREQTSGSPAPVCLSPLPFCKWHLPCIREEKNFPGKNISSEGSTGKSLQNPQSQRNLRTPGQGIRLEILKPRTGRKSSWDVADILTVKLLGQRQGVCLLLTWLWQANRLLGVRPGKWSMKFLSLSADTVTEERKGLRTISGLIKYA